MLKRAFVGRLRGERNHCKMVAVPTLAEENGKRPSRERERLVAERSQIDTRLKCAFVRLGIRNFNSKCANAMTKLEPLKMPEGLLIPPNTLAELRRDFERQAFIKQHIKAVEAERLERLAKAPDAGPSAMVRLLARIVGIGVETADMLVQEVLTRNIRDRRALDRYAGLTSSPDESGAKRREKGLSRSGNARVRRGMIQLAWRFLMFQKESALSIWYRQRTENAASTRKTLVVALARKLLIALWRLVRDGVVPDGVRLRPEPIAA